MSLLEGVTQALAELSVLELGARKGTIFGIGDKMRVNGCERVLKNKVSCL